MEIQITCWREEDHVVIELSDDGKGFKVTDDEVWEKVKDGTYPMFSIEGEAVREEVDDEEPEN